MAFIPRAQRQRSQHLQFNFTTAFAWNVGCIFLDIVKRLNELITNKYNTILQRFSMSCIAYLSQQRRNKSQEYHSSGNSHSKPAFLLAVTKQQMSIYHRLKWPLNHAGRVLRF